MESIRIEKPVYYELPDDFDIFKDTKKRYLGLPNLLDSEKYRRGSSVRYSLQNLNDPDHAARLDFHH